MLKDYAKLAGSSREISGEERSSKQAACVPHISLHFLEVAYKEIREQHSDTTDKLPNENKFATFDGLHLSSIPDSSKMGTDNLRQ